MVTASQTPTLLTFPFVDLSDAVDTILTSLCQKTLNLASGPPYHQILYSFRISRNNFRGAASILHERLQRLKTTSSKIHDPADESLAQIYLMIINTLSAVSKEDAYILAEQMMESSGAGGTLNWGIGQGKKLLKRQIVTLDTLRKEYQEELDRVAAIGRLVRNEWAQMATISPDRQVLHLYRNGTFSPYTPESNELPVVGSSLAWYRGRREALGFASIDPHAERGER